MIIEIYNQDYLAQVISNDLINVYVTDTITQVVEVSGEQGIPGIGVPSNGTTGQVLVKASDDAYDTEWVDPQTIEDVNWGEIGGTLSDQTDLQDELDLKANLSGADFTGDISATNLSGTNTGDQDLSGYELLSNKSTDTSLGTSDTLYPTQNAVKTYVDNQVSAEDLWDRDSINGYTYLKNTSDKVGIGTTAPSRNLSIIGSTTGILQLGNSTTGASSDRGLELFISGLNSGISNREAGYLRFDTNNLERVRIDSSGNVGIGTTSPSEKIDISGAIRSFVSGAAVKFQAYNPGTNYPRGQFLVGYSTSDVNTGLTFAPEYTSSGVSKTFSLEISTNKNPTDSSTRFVGLYQSSTYASIHSLGPSGNSAGTPLIFSTQTYLGNNPAIYISNAANQNVGIGTTSPNYKLDVLGGINITSNGSVTDTELSGFTTLNPYFGLTTPYSKITTRVGSNYVNSALTFSTLTSSSLTEKMRITEGGNVGIGTTSPSSGLHINNKQNPLRMSHTGFDAFEFYFSAGTGIGIRNATDSTLPFYISGTDNVGIGTTSPQNKVDVRTSDDTYGLRVVVDGTANDIYTGIKFAYDQATLTNDYKLGSIQAYKRSFGGGDLIFNSASSSSAYNTNQLVLSKTGNIGIGTTSPTAKLDISINEGNTTTVNYLNFTNSASGYVDWALAKTGSNDLSFINRGGAGSGTDAVMTIKYVAGSGNIGIGTTSPGYNLDIESSANPTMRIHQSVTNGGSPGIYLDGSRSTTGNVGQIFFFNNLDSVAAITSPWVANDAAGLIFSTQATGGTLTERMTITSSGNVGIGTTTPGYLLDVNGIARIGNADSTGIYIGGTQRHIWARSSGALAIGTGGGDKVTINSTGDVGIGTTAPLTKLDVNGSAKFGTQLKTPAQTVTIGGHVNFAKVDPPSSAQLSAIILTNTGAGSIPAGTYYYAVTYYTANGDASGGYAYTTLPTITLSSSSQVALSNIPISTDPRVVGRKIYRSQAGTVGDYYYVYHIATISNNTATTYTDNSAINTTATDWWYNKGDYTTGRFYIDNVPAMTNNEYNTAFGRNTFTYLTKGTNNTAFGTNVLSATTSGSSNVGIGPSALPGITTGSDNIGIGYAAMQLQNTGNHNIAIGSNAVRSNSSWTGSQNIGIGTASLYQPNATGVSFNVAVGYCAGAHATNLGGASNVYIGPYTGNRTSSSSNSGSGNTFIGGWAGQTSATGANYNILVGYGTELAVAGNSNQLNIGNIIYGTGVGITGNTPSATGKIGIGTVSPTYTLDVVGKAYTSTGFVTANNQGLSSKRASGTTQDVILLDSGDDIQIGSSALANDINLRSSTGTLMTVLTGGNVGIGTTSPDTKLDINGALTQRPLSSDPSDPDDGNSVMWVSDGTGSGDAGDVMMKINVGGTVKTITLVDYSAL